MWAGKVPAGHELLPALHAMLDPRAGPLSWLANAILSLSNDPFEMLLVYGGQQRLAKRGYNVSPVASAGEPV